MAYQAMITAIKADVNTKLGTGGFNYSIQYENDPAFQKPDNAVWIRASIRPAGANTVCISEKNTYRQEGILDLQVNAPFGFGETEVNLAVERCIQAYDYVNINVGDAEGTIVKFDMAPYPTVVGRAAGEHQVNVTCPYRADFTQT